LTYLLIINNAGSDLPVALGLLVALGNDLGLLMALGNDLGLLVALGNVSGLFASSNGARWKRLWPALGDVWPSSKA
jgi:hypothetical protein